MNGKLIQSQQVAFEQKRRLPLSLPDGIYCLKISNKVQFSTTVFMVK